MFENGFIEKTIPNFNIKNACYIKLLIFFIFNNNVQLKKVTNKNKSKLSYTKHTALR